MKLFFYTHGKGQLGFAYPAKEYEAEKISVSATGALGYPYFDLENPKEGTPRRISSNMLFIVEQ